MVLPTDQHALKTAEDGRNAFQFIVHNIRVKQSLVSANSSSGPAYPPSRNENPSQAWEIARAFDTSKDIRVEWGI